MSTSKGRHPAVTTTRRARHRWPGCSVLVLVLTGTAACGSDGNGDGDGGDSSVAVAEARVAAEQEDLADAKADLEEKSAAFCGASQTYIVALDRYGDVLSETAVTVGDVRDAGDDLAEPQDDVVAGAEAAVDAQQAVVDAERGLAEAKAALKAAKSGDPAPTTTAPAEEASPSPMASAEVVNRVKQAEAEFVAAQEGVTDETPLAAAAQQYNAAAVALEMAWLALYADAGCLTDEQQQQAVVAVRNYTAALQQSLSDAGHYQGAVDGIYGPTTVAAVEGLQSAHGLPTTGTVDKATAAALEGDLAAQGGVAAEQALASTAAVQQTLKLAGFWDGPVDGEWTPALTEALESFQTELGVKPTGTVDAATVAAVEKAIADAAAEPSASPTDDSETPSAPASPTDTSTPTS